MTDKMTNTEIKYHLKDAAPYVLALDLLLALGIFLLKGVIFTGKENADYLGNMLAIAFVIAGVFSYVILKLIGKNLSRTRND